MSLQIYHQNVTDIVLSEVYGSLSPERQADVDRKRFENDKKLSAGAGLLLRYAFKNAEISEDFPVIEKNLFGKPYLRDYPDIHFNISHSGKYVFLAVSDKEVGCDVEEIKPFRDFNSSRLAIAEHFFSEGEVRAINGTPELSEKNLLFYKIWTMKESFIKAKGGGLSIPLDSFDVLSGEGTEGAVFQNHELSEGYVFTTCELKNGQD